MKKPDTKNTEIRSVGKKSVFWLGTAMSALASIFVGFAAVANLFTPEIFEAENLATGVPMEISMAVGTLAAIGTILYIIPKTAFLGAITITGFLGGAIAINYRVDASLLSPPIVMCQLMGLFAWGGLYLRNPLLRKLLPFTHKSES